MNEREVDSGNVMTIFDRNKFGRLLLEGMRAGWARCVRGLHIDIDIDRRRKRKPSLALLDRITLAPRQSLALVEAEGRRFLVATSVESGPVFYPLEGPSSGTPTSTARHRLKRQPARAPERVFGRVSNKVSARALW